MWAHTHQPEARDRRVDQEHLKVQLTQLFYKGRSFLSTTEIAEQKAGTSTADPAPGSRLETRLPPLVSITFSCCKVL